jgi:hypothetical protein
MVSFVLSFLALLCLALFVWGAVFFKWRNYERFRLAEMEKEKVIDLRQKIAERAERLAEKTKKKV